MKTVYKLIIIAALLCGAAASTRAQYPALLSSTWYYIGFAEKTNLSFAVVPGGCALKSMQFYCDNDNALLLFGVPDASVEITNDMAASTRSNITCTAGNGDYGGGTIAILYQKSNNLYRTAIVHSNPDGGLILSNAVGGYFVPNIPLYSNDIIYLCQHPVIVSKGENDAAGNPIPSMWTGDPLYGGRGADPAAYIQYIPSGSTPTTVTSCYVNLFGTR